MRQDGQRDNHAVWTVLKLGLAYALIASALPPASSEAGPVAAGEAQAAQASSPAEVPARKWTDIAWAVWERIGKDRVVAVAAGFTFYALLAVFPAITAFVSIYGLFADARIIDRHLGDLSAVLPGGALDVISDQVQRLVAQGSSKLSTAFGIGLAVAIWSSNAGMKAMFDALNVAYQESETRGFFRLNLQSLAFTAGALVFIPLALGLIVVEPWLLKLLSVDMPLVALGMKAVSWIVLMAVVVLGLALLYRFGPARKKPAWRWVTPGSIFAGVTWLAASVGFSWYAQEFGSYNKTYGSLGAVVGFMTWMWISATVILAGAELNAETEQQAKGLPATRETDRDGGERS